MAEGNLSLEGPASSSVLHPSDHHNEKGERLKAMNKDMFGVRGGGEGSVEQLVSLLTGLQSFFFFFFYICRNNSNLLSHLPKWMK